MENMTTRHLIGSKILLRSEGANNVSSFQQLLDDVIMDPTLSLGLSISHSDNNAIWLGNLIQANDLAFLSKNEVAIDEDVSVIKLALCRLIRCGGSVPLWHDEKRSRFDQWYLTFWQCTE
jgi:hypothetical protein